MIRMIDCGRWQVLFQGLGVAADDPDCATYDRIVCVYDTVSDTALTGELVERTVYSTIPGWVLTAALRAAAGLAARGDCYSRYLQRYADTV